MQQAMQHLLASKIVVADVPTRNIENYLVGAAKERRITGIEPSKHRMHGAQPPHMYVILGLVRYVLYWACTSLGLRAQRFRLFFSQVRR